MSTITLTAIVALTWAILFVVGTYTVVNAYRDNKKRVNTHKAILGVDSKLY